MVESGTGGPCHERAPDTAVVPARLLPFSPPGKVSLRNKSAGGFPVLSASGWADAERKWSTAVGAQAYP